MFNVKVLDEAVKALPLEAQNELKKMIDIFEDYKAEVAKLEETANAYEIVCNNQAKEIEELKAELTAKTKVAQPDPSFIPTDELSTL